MNRFLLLGLALLSASAQADCGYRPLVIAPETAALYVGFGERVRVEFDNYKLDGEVDSFPEPPLRIRRDAALCQVDGGIWRRDGVYLDRAERRLLVQSFSGSGGELTIFDTASCAELARLVLPEASWALQGDSLVVGRQCREAGLEHCTLREVHALDADCLPD